MLGLHHARRPGARAVRHPGAQPGCGAPDAAAHWRGAGRHRRRPSPLAQPVRGELAPAVQLPARNRRGGLSLATWRPGDPRRTGARRSRHPESGPAALHRRRGRGARGHLGGRRRVDRRWRAGQSDRDRDDPGQRDPADAARGGPDQRRAGDGRGGAAPAPHFGAENVRRRSRSRAEPPGRGGVVDAQRARRHARDHRNRVGRRAPRRAAGLPPNCRGPRLAAPYPRGDRRRADGRGRGPEGDGRHARPHGPCRRSLPPRAGLRPRGPGQPANAAPVGRHQRGKHRGVARQRRFVGPQHGPGRAVGLRAQPGTRAGAGRGFADGTRRHCRACAQHPRHRHGQGRTVPNRSIGSRHRRRRERADLRPPRRRHPADCHCHHGSAPAPARRVRGDARHSRDHPRQGPDLAQPQRRAADGRAVAARERRRRGRPVPHRDPVHGAFRVSRRRGADRALRQRPRPGRRQDGHVPHPRHRRR